jgi:hypothetical protein
VAAVVTARSGATGEAGVPLRTDAVRIGERALAEFPRRTASARTSGRTTEDQGAVGDRRKTKNWCGRELGSYAAPEEAESDEEALR